MTISVDIGPEVQAELARQAAARVRAERLPRRTGRELIGRARGEGEEGWQDEIHMPGVRTERMGKPDTVLICGACYEDGEGEISLMLAEPSDEAP
jgi:hypothetical protein